MARFDAFLVTCEHATNHVPDNLRAVLADQALLESHRGYDLGALPLAREIAKAFSAPLFEGEVSRLVVDLNRSPGHPRLFHSSAKSLSPEARKQILDRYYFPYRRAVEDKIASTDGCILHVSVHSFTSELDGVARTADIGLLYDPRRAIERGLASAWALTLRTKFALYRVRRNYPYRGVSDGLVTHLRRVFPEERYCGIELEVNQAIAANEERAPAMRQAIVDSLMEVLGKERT